MLYKHLKTFFLIFLIGILSLGCLEVKLRLITTEKPKNDFYYTATDINRTNAHAFFENGKLYLEDKDYKDAVKNFDKAVKIKPDFAEAYVGLGSSYLKLEKYEKALYNYQKAIQIEPDYIFAKEKLGQVYMISNNLNSAEKVFGEIIEKDSGNIIALESLGDIAYKKMDFIKALDFWQKALKLNKNSLDLEKKYESLNDYVKNYINTK